MAVRKIKKSWWVDFQYAGKRYRKRSPVNSKGGAWAYETQLRQKILKGEPLEEIESEEKQQAFREFAWKWHELYCKNNNEYSEIQEKMYILKSHLVHFFRKYPY